MVLSAGAKILRMDACPEVPEICRREPKSGLADALTEAANPCCQADIGNLV